MTTILTNTSAATSPSRTGPGASCPSNYDPRFLILRRALSPITGTTDVQASITTLQLGIHQRLQTKRGPEGKRRIVDWMTLDLNGTYFPVRPARQLQQAVGPDDVQLPVVRGRPHKHHLLRLVRFLEPDGKPGAEQLQRSGYNPKGLNVITTGIS